jgi:hypothetical protein
LFRTNTLSHEIFNVRSQDIITKVPTTSVGENLSDVYSISPDALSE